MSHKNLCKAPFTCIEISCNGNVTVCCPALNPTVIGNIYRQSFDDIWYSKEAQDLREDMLSRQFKTCNLKLCNPVSNLLQDRMLLENDDIEFSKTPPYPKYVKFCHDKHCNIKCITCRDDFIVNSKQETLKLNSYIDEVYLPILKNCETVALNGAGEAFASEHCKTLIKKIVEKYPNIKFDIHTNGVLCNKSLCDELGITDKICSIGISLHAFNKETFEKIHLASNYEMVMKNILWLSSLLKAGTLKRLHLYYVVQKMNYKEMIPFVKFATSIGANVYFWEYRDWGTKLSKNYNKLAVFEKQHPEYNKLAKILQNPIFKQQNVNLNSYLKSIKPISFREHFYERTKSIRRLIKLLLIMN